MAGTTRHAAAAAHGGGSTKGGNRSAPPALVDTLAAALQSTGTLEVAAELGLVGDRGDGGVAIASEPPPGLLGPTAEVDQAAMRMAQELAESGRRAKAEMRAQAAVRAKAEADGDADATAGGLGAPSSQGGGAGGAPAAGADAAPAEKGSKGLRHFSLKVCEKVESKQRTTYNEVADELVAEFATPEGQQPPPGEPAYDEKNIRRRVYDALNVLMAMDIISRDKKKEILWKGLPSASEAEIEHLRSEKIRAASRIEKKKQYLAELTEQLEVRKALVARNAAAGPGARQANAVKLPFLLVQTSKHAVVDIEISQDSHLVNVDFNGSPFFIHDDSFVLKSLRSE